MKCLAKKKRDIMTSRSIVLSIVLVFSGPMTSPLFAADEAKESEPSKELKKFKKPKSSKKLIETNIKNFKVWINKREWKNKITDDPKKINLIYKDEGAHAILIAEKVQIPAKALRKVVLNSMEASATDVEVLSAENRLVNGVEVLFLKTRVEMNLIRYIFVGYYYTGEAGTFQVMTLTEQDLFDHYKTQLMDFLNGIDISD